MTDDFIRDEAFLLTAREDPGKSRTALTHAAATIWAKIYNRPRQCDPTKFRVRRQAKFKSVQQGTLKAWRLKRRNNVDQIVLETRANQGALVADAPAPGGDEGVEIEQEVLFQRRKRFKRAIASMREGSLLPAEQVAVFGSEEGAQQCLVGSEYLAQANLEKHRRAYAARKLNAAPTISGLLLGKRVHVDKVVSNLVSRSVLDGALASFGAEYEQVREKADVFLVPDVTQPGQRVLLNAVLAGLTLVSLQCLLSGIGPQVTYKRALRTRRIVWFSPQFMFRHESLIGIFLARLAAPNDWRVVSEQESFLESVGRRPQLHHFAFVVLRTEIGEIEAHRNLKLLTAGKALELLAVVDRNLSAIGMCSK